MGSFGRPRLNTHPAVPAPAPGLPPLRAPPFGSIKWANGPRPVLGGWEQTDRRGFAAIPLAQGPVTQ